MLKILLYAPLVGRGGIRRVCELFSRELSRRPDVHFRVLSYGVDEEYGLIDWPDGTLIKLTDTDPPPHPNLFGFLEMGQEKFYARLQQVSQDFDIVWCPQPWWTQQVMEWNIPAKLVATIHDFAFDQMDMGIAGQHFRLEASMFSHRSMHTIFPSNVQRMHAIEHYDFQPAKTSVIRYAGLLPPKYTANLEGVERIREKYGLPDGYLLAFHCAYHKGVDVILKAHHMAYTRGGCSLPLVIAGLQTDRYVRGMSNLRPEQVDGHVREIRRLISSLGYQLKDNLFILGEVPNEDIGHINAGATAAIVASVTDAGLSGNIFEAAFAGTPVIYSDVEQFTEVLGNDGSVGYPFAPRNAVKLSKAIIEVCSSPSESRARASRLLKRLMERTWDDVIEDYLNVFRKVKDAPAGKSFDHGYREDFRPTSP